MTKKYIARAIAVEVNDEAMIGIEIPADAISELNLVDGQILDISIEDDGKTLVFKKTNQIHHGND